MSLIVVIQLFLRLLGNLQIRLKLEIAFYIGVFSFTTDRNDICVWSAQNFISIGFRNYSKLRDYQDTNTTAINSVDITRNHPRHVWNCCETANEFAYSIGSRPTRFVQREYRSIALTCTYWIFVNLWYRLLCPTHAVSDRRLGNSECSSRNCWNIVNMVS